MNRLFRAKGIKLPIRSLSTSFKYFIISIFICLDGGFGFTRFIDVSPNECFQLFKNLVDRWVDCLIIWPHTWKVGPIESVCSSASLFSVTLANPTLQVSLILMHQTGLFTFFFASLVCVLSLKKSCCLLKVLINKWNFLIRESCVWVFSLFLCQHDP